MLFRSGFEGASSPLGRVFAAACRGTAAAVVALAGLLAPKRTTLGGCCCEVAAEEGAVEARAGRSCLVLPFRLLHGFLILAVALAASPHYLR